MQHHRSSISSVFKFLLSSTSRHYFVGSSSSTRARALINLPKESWMMTLRRKYTSSVEVDKEVDTINLKFAEAREEIESAMESKETVYFNEEAECAREAVGQVVELYKGLLNKVSENERGAIQRSMGLKIEQLKAELGQLSDD